MKIKIILLIILVPGALIFSCRKGSGGQPKPPNPTVDSTGIIKPQTDPPLAASIGFFMDDWQAKNFSVPTSYTQVAAPASATYTVTIDRSTVITKIPLSIAGNNANIWMGDMINETALLDHLTTLHPHIIRFPGGSLSDVYFWNAPKNQPPTDAPSQLLKADGSYTSAGYWYGLNTENWTISVDKYYAMLLQTGNQGMLTMNYGYARYGTGTNPVASAAHLAADWVRYDNGRTKYWEIGNENFGEWEAGYRIKTADNKDGQPEYLSGVLYGQHFKVFADSMRKAAQEKGKTIQIGAVLSESAPQSWWTATAKNWNSGVFTGSGASPDFYIVHNYYTNYQTNAGATEILNTPEPVTKTMMDYVKQSINNAGLALKPVILGEWNIFSTGSKQAVSHINGLHAVMVLGEALKNQFAMTARWDLANGWANGDDHGMFNIGDEPDGVPKWTPRPAFFHMYFFQKYLGDRLLASNSTSSDLLSYASSFSSGEVGAVLVNKAADQKSVEIKVDNFKKGNRFYWYLLTGGGDNGEFSRKVLVNGSGTNYASGGPVNYKSIAPNSATATGPIRLTIPGRAVVFVVIEKAA